MNSFTEDFNSGGRPNFGNVPPPKRQEAKCDDCGLTETEVKATGRDWGDGEILRSYGDEKSCRPCANGGTDETTELQYVESVDSQLRRVRAKRCYDQEKEFFGG